jgi:creatinine amidohydrolase
MVKYWTKLTSLEVNTLDRSNTIVVLPVGSTEQHGSHLPLETDTKIVEKIVKEAAVSIQNELTILILPAVWVGYSPHHMDFAGSITLNTETYINVIYEICQSVIHHGFRKVVIINGHGGNTNHIKVAASKIGVETDSYVLAASYWELMQEEIQKYTQEKTIGHAGEAETSLQLYLSPDLVNENEVATAKEIKENDFLPPSSWLFQNFSALTKKGYLGQPSRGNKELGKILFNTAVKKVAGLFLDFNKQIDNH